MKKLALLLALVLCFASFVSCGRAKLQSESFFFMDTVITVTLYTEDGLQAADVFDGCRAILSDLDSLWTRHGKGTAGDVYRCNQNESIIEHLDSRTVSLLRTALEVSGKTGGAFDITAAPMLDLWQSCGAENRLPTPEELEHVKSLVGFEGLALEGQTLKKERGEIRIDLGGIGKGGACDALISYLVGTNIRGGLVTFGSNVAVFGEKPDGSPFRIALRDPKNAAGTVGEVLLRGGEVLSVSGDYERYVTVGGERYHHIVDPDSGYPSQSGLSSVTVICHDGALADALSTALLVLGRERALELYEESVLDFEAILIASDGTLTVTEGLADRYSS